MITLYIDCVMRKNQNVITKEIPNLSEVQQYELKTRQTLVQLYRFLQAKDIFIQTYIQYLSERLLGGTVSKIQAEKELEFAAKFKQECGDTFANQTEQMVNDIINQKELSDQFKKISKKIKTGQRY